MLISIWRFTITTIITTTLKITLRAILLSCSKKVKRKNLINIIDYEIWHEEYRGDDNTNDYWHGIFFIPVLKKQGIINLLKKIRKEY